MAKKLRRILPVNLIMLFTLIFFSSCSDRTSSSSINAPAEAPPVSAKPKDPDPNEIPKEKLALIGKILVFGTENPTFGKNGVWSGKAKCPLCHMFLPEQRADRAPVLVGMEVRSHGRVKEERYKKFMDRLSNGEPNSGFKPHAQTGGEYILESEYCPNCYIPEGFGIAGTKDRESAMPIMNKPPISLTDFELVAIAAYIQSKDTPGDYSKVTAVQDWEHYFGEKIPMKPEDIYLVAHLRPPPQVDPPPPKMQIALESDTPEEIVQKMSCFACHKIPGISIAKTGMIGPLLIMKTSAEKRIKSAEYQKAVKEGKAHAATSREYVIESIIKPGAFIVPGFADDMFKDYSHKFTLAGFDKLVDYLLQQDEEAAIKDGLDRLPNEREGSLRKGRPLLERSE